MEIVHVVLGKANPDRMNGVNKVVNELAIQQSLAGLEVSVWGITSSTVHDYPSRPYTTFLFHAYKNPFTLDPGLIAGLDRIKGKAVFHLHGGFIPVFYALSKQLYARNIPFVFTPHGSYNIIALRRSWLWKKIYFALFERGLLRRAKTIHSLGKSEVEGLQSIFPNMKSHLIPYGFNPRPVDIHMVKQSRFIFGFCGRIDIYTKGLDILLLAFARFQLDVPDAVLWIIGDGRDTDRLQRMAKELSAPNIHFWGSRFGEQKAELLQQLAVFVHPSRNEGLPTAVLEAAAYGIPCIVTEATNTGDAIKQFDCGEVISLPDHELLYRALKKIYYRLHTNPDDVSSNAERMVVSLYNWKNIVWDFNELYRA